MLANIMLLLKYLKNQSNYESFHNFTVTDTFCMCTWLCKELRNKTQKNCKLKIFVQKTTETIRLVLLISQYIFRYFFCTLSYLFAVYTLFIFVLACTGHWFRVRRLVFRMCSVTNLMILEKSLKVVTLSSSSKG